jgi:hypothetical protein
MREWRNAMRVEWSNTIGQQSLELIRAFTSLLSCGQSVLIDLKKRLRNFGSASTTDF